MATAKTIYRHFDAIRNFEEEKKWHDNEISRILRLERIETHKNCMLRAKIERKKQQFEQMREKNSSFLRVLTDANEFTDASSQRGCGQIDCSSASCLSTVKNYDAVTSTLEATISAVKDVSSAQELPSSANARCITCNELFSECEPAESAESLGDSKLRPYVAKAFFIRLYVS